KRHPRSRFDQDTYCNKRLELAIGMLRLHRMHGRANDTVIRFTVLQFSSPDRMDSSVNQA
ncbi:MAG TPA: hypothetical protein VN039_06645, partial [Nitrospira sp.]|nr:hypothetical protein [Nitrospira sp.]